MKIFTVIFFVSLLLPGNIHAVENRSQGEQRLFLAYNIWQTDSASNQECINYKTGLLIHAGTEVVNACVFEEVDESGMFGGSQFRIVFKVKETGNKISIGFDRKWHPGKTIFDYYDMMFTSKAFSELTAGLSESEIKSIMAGTLTAGMSKEAVLIAYGYPPEHVTPNFANTDTWIYWRNMYAKKKICFDSQNRTIKCTLADAL